MASVFFSMGFAYKHLTRGIVLSAGVSFSVGVCARVLCVRVCVCVKESSSFILK